MAKQARPAGQPAAKTNPRPTARITSALFCERVLQEKDESLSVIRIADRITLDIPAEANIPAGIAVGVPTVLLLIFRKEKGPETGLHVAVRGKDPKGAVIFNGEASATLAEGEAKGANLILRFQFGATMGGFYWFDVTAEGELLTRIPLEVVLTRGGRSLSPKQ